MRNTMKKILASLCSLFLIAAMCIPAYAAAGDVTVTKNGNSASFYAYTEGADAAFDGDANTAYAGSITGQFEKRTVLTGMTVTAGAPIHGLSVSGSEDGINWIDLYQADRVDTAITYGYNGSAWSKGLTEGKEMYSYAWRYLRVEIAYGSIAELVLRGYTMEVVGNVSELDTGFHGTGWKYSKNVYESRGEDYMDDVTDHILGVQYEGAAIDKSDEIPHGTLILKAADDEPISAVSFMFRMGDGWGNRQRMAGVRFEGSADGENWTEIATLGTKSDQNVSSVSKDYFITVAGVNDKNLSYIEVDTAKGYHYIKLISGSATVSTLSQYLTVGTIDLYTKGDDGTVPSDILHKWEGNPFIAEKPDAAVETFGVQFTEVAGGKYHMRFVGKFAGACHDADHVGMNIVASWTEPNSAKQTRTFEAVTSTVYTSLLGKTGSVTQPIKADEGEYLFAIVINGIPAAYDVTFAITSYVEIGGYVFPDAETTIVVHYDAENGFTVTPSDHVIGDVA